MQQLNHLLDSSEVLPKLTIVSPLTTIELSKTTFPQAMDTIVQEVQRIKASQMFKGDVDVYFGVNDKSSSSPILIHELYRREVAFLQARVTQQGSFLNQVTKCSSQDQLNYAMKDHERKLQQIEYQRKSINEKYYINMQPTVFIEAAPQPMLYGFVRHNFTMKGKANLSAKIGIRRPVDRIRNVISEWTHKYTQPKPDNSPNSVSTKRGKFHNLRPIPPKYSLLAKNPLLDSVNFSLETPAQLSSSLLTGQQYSVGVNWGIPVNDQLFWKPKQTLNSTLNVDSKETANNETSATNLKPTVIPLKPHYLTFGLNKTVFKKFPSISFGSHEMNVSLNRFRTNYQLSYAKREHGYGAYINTLVGGLEQSNLRGLDPHQNPKKPMTTSDKVSLSVTHQLESTMNMSETVPSGSLAEVRGELAMPLLSTSPFVKATFRMRQAIDGGQVRDWGYLKTVPSDSNQTNKQVPQTHTQQTVSYIKPYSSLWHLLGYCSFEYNFGIQLLVGHRGLLPIDLPDLSRVRGWRRLGHLQATIGDHELTNNQSNSHQKQNRKPLKINIPPILASSYGSAKINYYNYPGFRKIGITPFIYAHSGLVCKIGNLMHFSRSKSEYLPSVISFLSSLGFGLSYAVAPHMQIELVCTTLQYNHNNRSNSHPLTRDQHLPFQVRVGFYD